jgi:hypothetical protein
MRELTIPLTDDQYDAIDRLIRLPVSSGRWATVEDFLAEHLTYAVQLAFQYAPPEVVVEKRNQLAQIQSEIDNYAKLTNVQIVSAADSTPAVATSP